MRSGSPSGRSPISIRNVIRKLSIIISAWNCRIYMYNDIYIYIYIYIYIFLMSTSSRRLVDKTRSNIFIIFNTNTTLIDRPIDLSVLLVQILLPFVLSSACLLFIYRLQNFLIKSIILFIPQNLARRGVGRHPVSARLLTPFACTHHDATFRANVPICKLRRCDRQAVRASFLPS